MAAKYSAENGKTRVLPVQDNGKKAATAEESDLVEVFTPDPSSLSPLYRSKRVLMTERDARELDRRPKWIPVLDKCSVECGGSKQSLLKTSAMEHEHFLLHRLDQRELRLSGPRPPGGSRAVRRRGEAEDSQDFLQRAAVQVTAKCLGSVQEL